MKKSNLILAIGALAFSFASCGTNKNSVDSSISLKDKKWHLVSLEGDKNEAFADTALYNISFPNDSTINGIGSCNNFFGSYKANTENDSIDIMMGGATQMACPNLNLEQNMFIALDEVDKYSIKDSTLTLFKGDKEVATFK